ncbi:MAG: PD40 domain-containing protein [Mucilaginibacter sp.]|nr:PD40 domain-containing protein [Mucilaginibacter sp.]
MLVKPLLSLLALVAVSTAYGQQKGYYRTPALHQNTVIFTAEGDLWKYDLNSNQSSRLTTNDGVELNPAISPDGKQVAFLGQYEGITEVYVMDINGGVPKRLTYELTNGQFISGWTKDGKILYRSEGNTALPQPQLIKLDPLTLKRQTVPLWQASLGSYDEDGVLYFTRFPNQGSKTKRYKGGLIEQIWKFDGKQEAKTLTGDFEGTSTSPMYSSGRVYFLSDRDGTMNLWSIDKNGKDPKQLTTSKGWDLQTPTMDGGRVVYQKGADIYLYDIASNTEKQLNINLISDFDQRKAKWIKSPVKSISYSDISPRGTYVAIVSRGRLFVSPAKSDRWVEITRKSGIRVKDVHFIDDKSIAVLSDEGGEYEVWRVNADGSGEAKQLTKGSKVIISSFAVSPDGKFIAYNDKNDVLRIAETATGAIKFQYDKAYGGINELSWSPNSTFLNISQNLENLNSQISVIDTRNMKLTPVTTTRLNSGSPAWSADGKWLYS